MKRIVLFFLILCASVLQAAARDEGCVICSKGRDRPVQSQHGGPDPEKVCFYVAMPDPCDSVTVEAHDGGKVSVIEDLGLGAAVLFAEKSPFRRGKDGKFVVQCTGREKAMVCVPKDAIRKPNLTLLLKPGNQGTCHVIQRAQLDELLKGGSWGPDRPLRLGWKARGAGEAPTGFATLKK